MVAGMDSIDTLPDLDAAPPVDALPEPVAHDETADLPIEPPS